jgi:hypothetical protein
MGISEQEMLDEVATNLRLKTKRATKDGGNCVFQAPSGDRCAIGDLMPDDHPALGESWNADQLAREYPELVGVAIPDTPNGVPLALSLQSVHDDFRNWAITEDGAPLGFAGEPGLMRVATEYGLSYPPPTERVLTNGYTTSAIRLDLGLGRDTGRPAVVKEIWEPALLPSCPWDGCGRAVTKLAYSFQCGHCGDTWEDDGGEDKTCTCGEHGNFAGYICPYCTIPTNVADLAPKNFITNGEAGKSFDSFTKVVEYITNKPYLDKLFYVAGAGNMGELAERTKYHRSVILNAINVDGLKLNNRTLRSIQALGENPEGWAWRKVLFLAPDWLALARQVNQVSFTEVDDILSERSDLAAELFNDDYPNGDEEYEEELKVPSDRHHLIEDLVEVFTSLGWGLEKVS